MTAPRIIAWRAWRNEAGTVHGFLDAELPSGLVIRGMKLMGGPKGTPWIAMPATKRDVPDGKAVWDPIVEFDSRATRERFTAAVLQALRAAHPEAFEQGELKI